jgi:PhnB protein
MAKKKVKTKKTAVKASKKQTSKTKSVKASAKKTAQAAPSGRPKWISEGSTAISALLIVSDVEAALDFYQTVFGFRTKAVMKARDNSIIHAEMTYRDSVVMLNPENRKIGAFVPQGRSPVTMYIYVADVDAVADVARLNGGNIVQAPADMFWGDRCSMIIDPDGHSWMVATHVRKIPIDEMVLP